MDFHEIADVFPMLPDPELEELTADIKLNGQIRPIVIFDDKILDGRNRYLACRKARIEPQFTKFFGDWAAAVRFVMSENLRRRHLNESQRGLVAAKIANLKPGRPSKETGSIDPVSIDQAAQQMSVGSATAKRAKAVTERGVPELVAAVERDEIKVSAANELTKLPPDKQREVLAGGKAKVSETVRELRAKPPVRRTELTEAEQAARRQRDITISVDQLAETVLTVKDAVQKLSTTTITPDAHEVLSSLVGDLRITADWLETITKGQGVPDSVPASWLEDGKNQ